MDALNKITLKKTDTMQLAIEVLNQERSRIVLIIENKKLLGTVTDGDIRRALLKHSNMETPLSMIMFKTPTVAPYTLNNEEILSLMKKKGLLQIPIINEKEEVIDIKTIKNFLSINHLDNPILIMAGGFGTRMKPLTDHVPKPLLKVGNKPILETIIDRFISAGFKNFYISTHYKAEMIHEYFGDGSKWDISIKYINESKPLGTAGSLSLLPKDFPNLPMIVMNCDLLTKVSFINLLDFHNNKGGDATMCVREYDFQVPYGVIKAKNHKITKIIEKPIEKFFVNAGIYILNPYLIKNFKSPTPIDMTDFLQKIVENSGQVNIFPVHEYWLDIGMNREYERAQIDNQKLF